MMARTIWRLAGLVFAVGTVTALAGTPQTKYKVSFVPQKSGVESSFRGLSAVNKKVAWVSGTGGTILRTIDGGLTWATSRVPGADSLDFRDVAAFDEYTSYILSAGPGDNSRIYKTTDGGDTWHRQFTNSFETGFFDGFDFWDRVHGIAYSDPVAGRPLVITTMDGGGHWLRVAPENLPKIEKDEYGFAASGTGIVVAESGNVWICTGGEAARVFHSADQGKTWGTSSTQIVHGSQTKGIFSIAFRDKQHGLAVGGDYRNPRTAGGNVALTNDGGHTWQKADAAGVVAFLSCVQYVPEHPDLVVAVGSDGNSTSLDGGLTWSNLDGVGYHTLSFGNSSESGWAAGADGRVAKCLIKTIAQ